MAAIVIKGFRGMRPITDPKLLDASEAQLAQDCRLQSGDIQPVRESQTVIPLKTTVASEVSTIFRAQDTADENANWLEFTADVDVMLSPITQDDYRRIYWTGNGVPRYAPANVAFSSGAGPYPRASYELGIPKPSQKPTATGTQVFTAGTAERTYIVTFTNEDGSKESAPSTAVTVKALTNHVDSGILFPNEFLKLSDTRFQFKFSEAHDLDVGDYLSFSNSTVIGWNASWKVVSVPNVKQVEIENTQDFPSYDPQGSFTCKKRYMAKVKLASLPTDDGGDANVKKKKIYRKVSGTYRQIAWLDLSTTEFEDIKLDSELASASAISSSILNRPAKPKLAPSTAVPYTDTSISDNKKYGTDDKTDTIEQPVYDRVYAVSYVSDTGVESGISKESAIVAVVDGKTEVRVMLSESVKSNVTKKRIYRQTVNKTTIGTYIIEQSQYKLLIETPVAQDLFVDGIADASIASNPSPSLLNSIDPPATAFVAVPTLFPKRIAESRIYVYTYVSAYGEEGPPSDPSDMADIDPMEPVIVTTGSAPVGNYNIAKKYIYRSSKGTATTDYQFVAEQSVASTSFTDKYKQIDLGETIPSTSWEAPPSDMKGLRMMANGIAVGFSGRDICFSEPFMPHAWPSKNFLPVDHDIVGIGAFGQSVAILTTSFPYVATGIDPESMTLVKTSLQQACVSKRSIVESGDSVIYASPDGLVRIGMGGAPQVVTQPLLTQEQWQSYNPSSIHGYLHEGCYYAFFKRTDGTSGLIIFNMIGTNAPMTLGSQYTKAAHVVPKADSLFICDGSSIKMLDKASTYKPFTWTTKVYEHPKPLNYSWAQLLSTNYGTGITVEVYAGGVLRHTKLVADTKPFRLPSGFVERDWYITVKGSAPVTAVLMAQSIDELKTV